MSDMKRIDNAIGFCELCGMSLTGDGIDTGPVTTIGWDCALQIAAIVNGTAPAVAASPSDDTPERSEANQRARRRAVAA